jgi:hypothetical protein
MKKFAEGSASLSKVAENADSLAIFSQALMKFADSFAPLAAPVEILASQLTAGTIESTIKLMESTFTLMENPVIVKTIEAVIWGLNKIIEGGINFTDWLDDNLQPMITAVKKSYDEDLKPILDALVAWIGTIGTKIDEFMNWWDVHVQPSMDATGVKIKELIDVLDLDVVGALDTLRESFQLLVQILKDLVGIDLTAFFDSVYKFFTGKGLDGNVYMRG